MKFRLGKPILFRKFSRLRRGESPDGYSLEDFEKYKCIFIHIPKCAGQSIRNSLFDNLIPGHITIYTYQMVYPKTLFDEYFKFTFVRNPWDRLVSSYLFLKAGGAHNKDRIWANNHLAVYEDFNDFIRRGLRKKDILQYPHFRPQIKFLLDQNGRLNIDFIGHLETIEEDFLKVTRYIDAKKNLLFINKTKTKSKDFREYYNPVTKKIVAKVYQKDIQTFGYDFDNQWKENENPVRRLNNKQGKKTGSDL